MIPDLDPRERTAVVLLAGLAGVAFGSIHFVLRLVSLLSGSTTVDVGLFAYLILGPGIVAAVCTYLLLRFGLVLPFLVAVLFTAGATESWIQQRPSVSWAESYPVFWPLWGALALVPGLLEALVRRVVGRDG